MAFFDFDNDGKTGMLDMLVGFEAFKLFIEYCDIKEKMRQNQEELDRLMGNNKSEEDDD